MSQTDRQNQLQTLRARLGEISDINNALSVLHWDQEVYMPPKGASGRALQLATLSSISHARATDPELGALLEDLAAAGLKGDDAKLVSETLHDYRRAVKLPDEFVREFSLAQSRAFEAWVKARKDSDFAAFQPHLQTIVDLLRRRADYMGYEGSPYNALLEDYERGMRVDSLKPVFATLAKEQSRIVDAVTNSPHQPETAWLDQEWDEQTQWDFALQVAADFGYDLEAGRMDRSVHPFSTGFGIRDVRITTRLSKDELFMGLTGAMHETGHAMYEQGLREEDERTTLGEAISLGVHESQSRMWENMIGRGRAFWEHYTPKLREAFPLQMQDVSPEDVYRAVNRVQPSLIRVEADECTYNLHIVLRFEIEIDLIENRLAVKDVPEAWNAKVKQYLGLDVPGDAMGCLQDIHWSHGSMGYFPTYALGNLYAAQMFERIEKDVPLLWTGVERGDFSPLLNWLREHVHRVGRRMTAPELIQSITGKPLSPEPYLNYLKSKFGGLYQVSL
ncbi:MAG: carboxypeptidase M32 [bacterium]|nr:carboxypeptidase M32 [bacterium]